MKDRIVIRKYQEKDACALAQLFYQTIHKINKKDYTKKQLDAWAPERRPKNFWEDRWYKLPPTVAVINNVIVGFTEFDKKEYIDCFFVHHAYQGQGIGSVLMQAIFNQVEEKGIERIWAEVSITAQPFFKSKGFNIVKEQIVVFQGVEMKNAVMERYTS